MSSKLLKATSLVLSVFLLLVTLDISLNGGSFSRKYIPSSLLDRFEGVGEEIGQTVWDTFGMDPVQRALEEHLNSEEELSEVRPIAEKLKGADILESAWNVLFWEDGHINYDNSRTDPLVQPIPEILKTGKGICGDYTLLTLALLLEMNYSPLYVLRISFNDSDVGHLTAAILYRKKLLIVDQHPPVMNRGAYYRYWAIYRREYLNETPHHIEGAVLYRVSWEDGSVNVEKVGRLSLGAFFAEDYNMTESDIFRVKYDLLSMITRSYGLSVDQSLPTLEEADHSPGSYSRLVVFRLLLPGYADFYLPESEEYFVKDVYRKIVSQKDIVTELSSGKSMWINVSKSDGSLSITLYIAY
jgi:hypothetical protein